jgi:hypothetical protein
MTVPQRACTQEMCDYFFIFCNFFYFCVKGLIQAYRTDGKPTDKDVILEETVADIAGGRRIGRLEQQMANWIQGVQARLCRPQSCCQKT